MLPKVQNMIPKIPSIINMWKRIDPQFSNQCEIVLWNNFFLEGCCFALPSVVEVPAPSVVTEGISFDLLGINTEYP